MLMSMTGYGKAKVTLPSVVIEVELKSLNGKQTEVFFRTPQALRSKEVELKKLLSAKLHRGRIECNICFSEEDTNKATKINPVVFAEYWKQLQETISPLGLNLSEDSINTVLRLPNVLEDENSPESLEVEWTKIFQGIEEAISNLVTFREQEGKCLKEDLLTRVGAISSLLKEVEQYERGRIEQSRERLVGLLQKEVGEQYDTNRLEQELIYYIEKWDITEEKVRLKNHCQYFIETANASDQEKGKKIGFIAQEMGREINTIGSKANNTDIQKIVVQMKDELEKIKEQSLNVL